MIARIFRHEALAGVLLMIAACAALIVANSGLAPAYEAMLGTELAITLNGEGLSKPLILWINDALMALFFLLVGMELKHELRQGKLKKPADVILPGMAAVGGMAVPALVFLWLNAGGPGANGWAIPAATDIAFALGVLALVGSRVPPSLKLFLLTLAILDDLGAIVIIALFYTADLQVGYLAAALLPIAGMLVLNLYGAHRLVPTLLLGAVLWYFLLQSGVHATLAGVITAFLVPLTDRFGKSPLHRLEDGLKPYVNFLVIPLFAFANAGVVLAGMQWASLLNPLPLGIALGLIAGKQIGVFGVTFLMVKTGLARLPAGAGWTQIYGISCLAGIGFTMSLFIGSLSFADPSLMNDVRLGVLSGSLVSGLLGYGVLRFARSSALAVMPPHATDQRQHVAGR